MNKILRAHADAIIESSINAVKPDEAVARALSGKEFPAVWCWLPLARLAGRWLRLPMIAWAIASMQVWS